MRRELLVVALGESRAPVPAGVTDFHGTPL